MTSYRRQAYWAMQFALGALLCSGATRPREVAAHSQGASLPSAGAQTPGSVESIETAASSETAERNQVALLRVPAGDYLPFYKGKNGVQTSPVAAFQVSAEPVVRRDFLRFVRSTPRWRRSRVERLFAEPAYLADWASDLDPGRSPLDGAVTSVSWFAAKAYCASIGLRLPTTLEWERALGVIGPSFDQAGSSNLATSLREWTADFNSIPLADGDPKDSGTNLFCGAGARATDATDYGAFLRYSFRSSLKADFALKNLGFRCAESDS